MRVIGLVLICCSLFAGCGDDDPVQGDASVVPDAEPEPVYRPECENLNPHHCMMPWPSSRFLAVDTTTETGFRIAIDSEALPTNRHGETSSSEMFARFDGFSPMTPIVTHFAAGVDTSSLAGPESIGLSLEMDSPTVIIDATSGERVPHWAELDAWDNPRQPDEYTAFYLRPAVRLEENRRYIVAIRDMRSPDGNALEPSSYFGALRDGTAHPNEEVDTRRDQFNGLFSELAEAGVARENLIEAWDFHVASGPSIWGDLVHMRDDMLERLGSEGIDCTIESVVDSPNDNVFREVQGTFTVPLYMDDAGAGAALPRGEDGMPAFQGFAEAPFTVIIPTSVAAMSAEDRASSRLMIYGHGLLGSGRQTASDGTRTVAERLGMVAAGTDYWGLSQSDEAIAATDVVSNWENLPKLTDRLMQGVLNFMALTRTVRGVCGERAALQIDGEPVFGPEVYYFGISQGGIMGATLAAMTPDIEGFGLQVGGVSYPLMMRRSVDFLRFELLLRAWYPDKLDRDWLIAASASLFDQSDPATFAPHLLAGTPPAVAPRRILYQTSRYDAEVPNISSDIGAHIMGLPWIPSSVYRPWGAVAAEGPVTSGYAIYQIEGVEPFPPICAPPLVDNEAHSGLRYVDSMQRQLDTFFAPEGLVADYCEGQCDPN